MAKIYAVKVGRKTGLFSTWASCEEAVKGYPNASYKSFKTKEDALAWLGGHPSKKETIATSQTMLSPNIDPDTLICYVDGSYESAKKQYAYGLVGLYQGRTYLDSGIGEEESWLRHHNVAGEILGAIKAFALAKSLGAKALTLYHDYEGICAWATGAWRANYPMTQDYQALALAFQKNTQLSCVKVKAHSGDPLNEKADQLAKMALQNQTQGE